MNERNRKRERWRGLKIAVIGGDEREQEIARLAAQSGAAVNAFGFPWPAADIAGVKRLPSAEAALADADIALFPIPGIAEDGSLFSHETIIPSADMLSRMAPDAHIILGKADDRLSAAARQCGIELHEYEADQELMLRRMPAIVEGALQLIIGNTVSTIHMARVCIVGQGNMGAALTRTLIALGARVVVAARNPVQRALAYTLGAETIPLDELAAEAPRVEILLSTVPVRIVTAEAIDRLPPSALIVDLAAPPGGVDLDYARRSGRRAIWARGLGRRAPVTVGASQWAGIARIIDGLP